MLQDPKKYNVYNDIFRYQDETFEDTENDETVDGTAGMVKMIFFYFLQFFCGTMVQ